MSTPTELMLQSPYEAGTRAPQLVQIRGGKRQTWVPSRFNARTKHQDGRLILWNTYTGGISVFKPEQREAVESLLSRQGFTAEPTGVAKYLVDRGFLVKQEVDEMRRVRMAYGQEQFRNDRIELILLASEDCNFRCTYCYEDFARGTMRPEVRQGVKALLQHRVRSTRHMVINWFGGEPLYGWDALSDLAPFIQEFCRENEISLFQQMTTNAYLLTPEIASQVLSWGIRTFQITLDGLAEDHDKRRQGRDGSPTFDRILANLRALHQTDERFHITLRVNYDKVNIPGIKPLLEVLKKELELDRRFEMYFFAVEAWGGPNDNDGSICGAHEADEAYWEFMEAAQGHGMNVGEGIREHKRGGGVCYAARPYNFVVGATGKLMKCTVALDKEDYNVVGELTPEGEVILDPDKLAMWTDASFESDKMCQHCHVLPICQGMHCPLDRLQSGERECMPVKRRLHKDLINVVNLSDTKARKRREQQLQAVPQPAV